MSLRKSQVEFIAHLQGFPAGVSAGLLAKRMGRQVVNVTRSARFLEAQGLLTINPKETSKAHIKLAVAQHKPAPDALGLVDVNIGREVAGEKVEASRLKPIPEPPAPTGLKLDDLVDRLASGLAAKVIEKMMFKVEQGMQNATDEISVAPQPLKIKKQEASVQKRPVVIIGLLPDQEKMIEKEFGDCFKIHYYGAEGSPTSIKEACKHADVVLTMTEFISHWVDDAVRAVQKDRHIRVRGGMSSLRQHLTDIFCA